MTHLPYRLVRVASGQFSVHSVAYGETFHPVVGPAAEAEVLYVQQLQLRERLARAEDFVIWDVGLGAAANALTVLRAIHDVSGSVQLLSFDQTLEPLSFALRHREQLGYLAGYEKILEALLSTGACAFSRANLSVTWKVHQGNFPSLLSSPCAATWPKPHVILYDAYSPAVNPEMWTEPVFARLFALLDPTRACALPTYSRSTLLRVTLLLAGFFVGKGYATGEKEETTIAANDPSLILKPLGQRWLQRVRNSTSAEPLWEPNYRQAPLSPSSLQKLCAHPQFRTSHSCAEA